MNERNKYLLFWAVFLSLIAISTWHFYPMRGWGWVEWVLAIWLIPGAELLIAFFISRKLANIISERRLNRILKEPQKKTMALLREIRAKKK